MALEQLRAEIAMLVQQMENEPEDIHELHARIRGKLNEIKAMGMPLPDDLVALERRLDGEQRAAARQETPRTARRATTGRAGRQPTARRAARSAKKAKRPAAKAASKAKKSAAKKSKRPAKAAKKARGSAAKKSKRSARGRR